MNERLMILRLIESGEISVEEGVRRLEALESTRGGGAAEAEATGGAQAVAGAAAELPRPGFLRILWQIVFGLGTAGMAGGGLLLARAYVRDSRPGLAWGWVIFALGLLVMLLGWWLRQARWFTLSVREHSGRTFKLALPLPLGLVVWLLRIVGPFVPQLRDSSADELVLAMREELRKGRPFAIEVDEGENGDRVAIHFG